jgi:hypothetical protein
MNRLRWFRIGLGFAIGLIFGLYYAWDVSPKRINRATPQDMDSAFQDEYRVLVAAAYANNGNLIQAEGRLNLLSDENPGQALNNLAQQRLAAGHPQIEVRALAQLADDLENSSVPTQTPLPTSTEAPELIATGSPRPSPTPTVTPAPLYRVERIENICDPSLPSPLIQILVLDPEGNQIPGVEISVQWENGEDLFITGMKPELGIGYADFEMEAEKAYSVIVVGGRDPATGISSESCSTTAGASYPGSVRLTFQAP